MTELEKYINSNLEAFDSEPVPEGSKARFMGRINAERRKRRIRVLSISFSSIAASFAAILFIIAEPDLSRQLQRHHIRMAEAESEIMVLAERMYPFETETIMSSVRSIISEAIPLEEQLPDEMSLKDKSRILNEYYNQKISALKEIMGEYEKSL